MRSDVCEFPAKGAALAVRDHNRGTDPVQQGRVAGVVVGGLQRGVVLYGDLGGVQGVEDRVAGEAAAWPLGVKGSLGVGGKVLRCGELLCVCFGGEERLLAFTWEPG